MGSVEEWAKRLAPQIVRCVPTRVPRNLGLYCDILQGRGAGTGWDMLGEATAIGRALPQRGTAVIVDAGANYGQWSAAVAAMLGSRPAHFFLVEPQASCQEALRALPLNKTILQTAIGDRVGQVAISGESAGFGATSIYVRRDTYFGDMTSHEELTPITTLDRIAEEFCIQRIDLLKLDIEGAEFAALRGAESTLAAGLVGAIAFEFGSANIYSRTFFRDFWDFLEPHGYVFHRIAPGGRLMKIERYSEELEHFRGVSNYVLTRSEL